MEAGAGDRQAHVGHAAAHALGLELARHADVAQAAVGDGVE